MRLPSGERISTDRSGSGDPSSAWWRKRWDSTHGLKNSPPDCFSPACGRVALFSSPPLKPPLKNAPTCGWCIPYWRKRWDSNPRALADYLISSQARYDHFDTLPYSHLQASGGEKTGVRLMRGVPPAMRFPRNRHGTIYHTFQKGKCQVFSAKKRAEGRQSCAKVLNESARCFILKNRKPGVLFSGRDARCDRGGITWQRSERNGIGRRSPL